MVFLQHILILACLTSVSTTTSESIISHSIYKSGTNELVQRENNLNNDKGELKSEGEILEEKKQLLKPIKNTDVIQLNVGGEIMMTTRQTLTKFPKSILGMMFNGRWENKLSKDKKGNIFLNFNPIIFRHLLDQLQILDKNNLFINIYPPIQSSLIKPFNKMIKKLNFNQSLLLDNNNIINFNVGGQIITNQHKTFNQISNSTLNKIIQSSKITKFHNESQIFLDFNPKLFQYLTKQLREKSFKNICSLEESLYKEKISFKIMINHLNICQQFVSSNNNNTNNIKWKQNGFTIAGGNGNGDQLNQLSSPFGIYIDDKNQSIYIADSYNNRIVEWKSNAKNGHIVAGGNRTDNLNRTTNVIVDKRNKSLIICDRGNERVIRLSHQNDRNVQTIISDIKCWGLAMDNNGDLYVSDTKRNEVRRWKIGEKNGTLVAGGNGEGNHLNQFHLPNYIFVDQNHSVYVSDEMNNRVIKWMKGAKEGIIVAGGQGEGKSLTQLSRPMGITVDEFGNVYVADSANNRIMSWLKESKEGSIIVGGNGSGEKPNQFNLPVDLAFDQHRNLYVVDLFNSRVQKFDIDNN